VRLDRQQGSRCCLAHGKRLLQAGVGGADLEGNVRLLLSRQQESGLGPVSGGAHLVAQAESGEERLLDADLGINLVAGNLEEAEIRVETWEVELHLRHVSEAREAAGSLHTRQQAGPGLAKCRVGLIRLRPAGSKTNVVLQPALDGIGH